MDLPGELKRREDRLARLAEIKIEMERRAAVRDAEERAAYDAKWAERAAKEQARSRKLGGTPPQEPIPGPRPNDQLNFTDAESRIMPVAGGGFVQADNAQATVTVGSLLIIGAHVTQHPNDKQEIAPALAECAQLPVLVRPSAGLNADNGYFSEQNVQQVVDAGMQPLIALGRQSHHDALEERLAPIPALPEQPTALQAMQHRLKTPEGRARYAKRKTTSEPVFGIIKEVMGFRRFSLRGLEKVKGEWRLVCLAFNLKRLCVLNPGVFAS